MLAKQYLKGILPANILNSMESFFKQAEYNLVYDANKKSGSEWLNKVAIAPTSQPLLPAKIDPEIFAQISTALYQNRFYRYIIEVFTEKSTKHKLSHLLWCNKARVVI